MGVVLTRGRVRELSGNGLTPVTRVLVTGQPVPRGKGHQARGAVSTPALSPTGPLLGSTCGALKSSDPPRGRPLLPNCPPAAGGLLPKDRVQLITARSEEGQERKATVTVKCDSEQRTRHHEDVKPGTGSSSNHTRGSCPREKDACLQLGERSVSQEVSG